MFIMYKIVMILNFRFNQICDRVQSLYIIGMWCRRRRRKKEYINRIRCGYFEFQI